jgi:hypothetical protein
MEDEGASVTIESPDTSRPEVAPKPVRVPVLLLAGAALAGVSRYLAVSYESIHSSDHLDSIGFTILGLAVRLVFWVALINDAFRGRRTSRFVVLALFASYVAEIAVTYNDLLVVPLRGVLALLQAGLLAAGVLQLYTQPARAWFNRHTTDHAQDVFPRYRGVFPALATLGGAAVLGVMAWSVRDIVSLHLVQTRGPVSVVQARACPIALPVTARNIQYRKYRHWVAFKDCVRFEAPVEDCIAHTRRVVGPGALKPYPDSPAWMPAGKDGKPDAELQAIWLASQAPRYAPWFDLASTKRGLTGGEGGSSQAQVWIDLDRGVFYYAMTD